MTPGNRLINPVLIIGSVRRERSDWVTDLVEQCTSQSGIIDALVQGYTGGWGSLASSSRGGCMPRGLGANDGQAEDCAIGLVRHPMLTAVDPNAL